MSVTIFGPEQDSLFMNAALEEARLALEKGEVPVGAVVVNEYGDIVARAHNLVEQLCTQTAHAEMRALEQAAALKGDWRLRWHWLYVTLEPCAMCMGLIRLSRLSGLVYGAPSPFFGFRLDNTGTSWVYKEDTLIIINNIQTEQSASLLQRFFEQKR